MSSTNSTTINSNSNNTTQRRYKSNSRGNKSRRNNNSTNQQRTNNQYKKSNNSQNNRYKQNGSGYNKYSNSNRVAAQSGDSVVTGVQGNRGASSKKVSANHLLNYKHKERRKPPIVTSAKYQWVPQFKKEKFINANYRIGVKTDVDCSNYLQRPDIPVEWNDIEVFFLTTPTVYNCPICLEAPVAARMTTCGHIFCWSCLLHFFSQKKWKPCPICFELTSDEDIKPTQIEVVHQWQPGDSISFMLIQRAKGSSIGFPVSTWKLEKSGAAPCATQEDSIFSRIVEINDKSIFIQREFTELGAAATEATAMGDYSLPYLEFASQQLEALRRQYICEVKEKAIEQMQQKQATNKAEIQEEALNKQERSSHVWDDDDDDDDDDSNVDADEKSTYIKLESVPSVLKCSSELTANVARPNCNIDADVIASSLFYYQDVSGLQVFLHPLCTRCLLQEFGAYHKFPLLLTAPVVEMEEIKITKQFRSRYRFLSHIPLSSTIYYCEVNLEGIVSKRTLKAFAHMFKAREESRREKNKPDTTSEQRNDELSQYISSGSKYSSVYELSATAAEFVPSSNVMQQINDSPEFPHLKEDGTISTDSNADGLNQASAKISNVTVDKSNSFLAAASNTRPFKARAKSKQRKKKQVVLLSNSLR